MKPIIKISFLIWIRAIFLNALLIGVYTFIREGFEGSVIFLLVLVVGFIVTVPLLVFIYAIVKLSVKIPYSAGGRLSWLAFSLAILVLAFYGFVLFLFGTPYSVNNELQQLVLAAVISAIIGTLSLRDSYSKLNEIIKS